MIASVIASTSAFLGGTATRSALSTVSPQEGHTAGRADGSMASWGDVGLFADVSFGASSVGMTDVGGVCFLW